MEVMGKTKASAASQAPPPRDHAIAIEKIAKGRELMTQLRALLMPLPPSDHSSELARDLFEEVLRSLAAALSVLRFCSCRPAASQVSSPYSSDDSRSKDSNGKRKTTEEKERSGGPNKRSQLNSWTSETSVPDFDGHQWRKYGQKPIRGTKFMRNYYKCTHGREQECPAKKTVQQKEGNDDPPKFIVSYRMQHTCRNIDTVSPFVVDSTPQNPYPCVPSSITQNENEENCSWKETHPLIDVMIPEDIWDWPWGILSPMRTCGSLYESFEV